MSKLICLAFVLTTLVASVGYAQSEDADESRKTDSTEESTEASENDEEDEEPDC